MEWLDGHPPYDPYILRLPIVHKPSTGDRGSYDIYDTQLTGHELILTKQKAWGAAPYVGRPFVYVWKVATDQYGRSIAGDTMIVHRDDLYPDAMYDWADPYELPVRD
jgi:hypothetical protein